MKECDYRSVALAIVYSGAHGIYMRTLLVQHSGGFREYKPAREKKERRQTEPIGPEVS